MAGIKKTARKKPLKTLTVCLSHKEDADGISSAALITGIWRQNYPSGLSRTDGCP